ncbi:MAG TPA: FHA domain-containing protein, partial [Gemmataceae bacterium]
VMPIPIDIDLFLIGDGPECQLRASHPDIGHEHCALVMRARKVFISDLDSGHPTYVNGEALPPGQEWPLHMGDRIKVGPLEFMIQFRERHTSKKDMEEWALRCLDTNARRRASVLDDLFESGAVTARGPSPSDVAGSILDRLSAQRGIVRGRLRVARAGDVIVVRINDMHLVEEAELAQLNKELREYLDRNNIKVLLDFKNVRRMSSFGAQMFANLAGWLHSKGGTVALCRLRSDLETLMRSYPGLQGVRIFHDKQAALDGKW